MPTELLVEPRSAKDEQLWPIFDEMEKNLSTTYDLLRADQGTLEEEKDSFFSSGCKTDPDLEVSSLNIEDLEKQEATLRLFKKELITRDLDPSVKRTYRWKVNEGLANIRMVIASKNGDMLRFRAYNRFIYGEPNPAIFAAVSDWFRSQAQSSLKHESSSVRQAAQQALHLVEDQNGKKETLIPQPEIFQLIKERHFREGGYYALLLAGVELPSKGKISREIGNPALNQVLKNIDSNYGLTENTGIGWAVDHRGEAVKHPAKYNLSLERFIGLPVGHEAGGHILEYQNGLRQPLRLLASGLDRYENGNEGRAVVREQIPYEKFVDFTGLIRWQDILRRHYAISLAEGLGADKPRSFHQVYAIINSIDRLWERSKNPADEALADAKADKRSWDLLTDRVFKGTDGKGGAYLKDKVYLEGNIACWRAAELDPGIIELGDLGKFDITNPRHIAIAQDFNVLPVVE